MSVHVYVHVCVHFVQQFFQDCARVVCVYILCSSFLGWCSHWTCEHVSILCSSFSRMVLTLYMCPFCAAVFPGRCSHCTCVHSVQQFYQDGARIVRVYIWCNSFSRTVLTWYMCTFCAAVLPGWCSHCTCVHSVQQFYQDGARIEAAFRKYFHRADPEQKGDSVEVIICHANVIRYFVCR